MTSRLVTALAGIAAARARAHRLLGGRLRLGPEQPEPGRGDHLVGRRLREDRASTPSSTCSASSTPTSSSSTPPSRRRRLERQGRPRRPASRRTTRPTRSRPPPAPSSPTTSRPASCRTSRLLRRQRPHRRVPAVADRAADLRRQDLLGAEQHPPRQRAVGEHRGARRAPASTRPSRPPTSTPGSPTCRSCATPGVEYPLALGNDWTQVQLFENVLIADLGAVQY